MPTDDTPTTAISAFADRACRELAGWDDRLDVLFADLQELDPDLAARACALIGSPKLAALLLFGPLDHLNGRSALQTALERGEDPLSMPILPGNGGAPES